MASSMASLTEYLVHRIFDNNLKNEYYIPVWFRDVWTWTGPRSFHMSADTTLHVVVDVDG